MPVPGPVSPVNLAASRGFSRSEAGLSWEANAISLTSPNAPMQAKWSPFRSEYTQRFAAYDSKLARVLNHERLVLEGGSQRLPPSSASLNERPISRPFGTARFGGDSQVLQGTKLEWTSYPDNNIRNVSIWDGVKR